MFRFLRDTFIIGFVMFGAAILVSSVNGCSAYVSEHQKGAPDPRLATLIQHVNQNADVSGTAVDLSSRVCRGAAHSAQSSLNTVADSGKRLGLTDEEITLLRNIDPSDACDLFRAAAE